MNKVIFFIAFLALVPFVINEIEATTQLNFTSTPETENDGIKDSGNNDICDGDVIISSSSRLYVFDLGDGQGDCQRHWFEFNITALTDGVTVTKVELIYEITAVTEPVRPCSFILFDDQPTLLVNTTLWNAIDTNQTTLVNSSTCNSNTGFQFVDLGINATTYAENQMSVDWFGLGWKFTNETLDADDHRYDFQDQSGGEPILRISFNDGIPDPVNDLVAVVVGDTAIDLTWNVPFLSGGQQNGTQINFTTPFGNPLTIVINDTNSNDTATTITGLSSGTGYSFRVSVWTFNGSNADGNIANGTTAEFGNFTVGFFELDASQFDERDIKYTRIDETNDIVKLEVIYPNAFNLNCTFDYRFQNTNQTFSSLTTVPEGATEQKATFQFNNASREIIRVSCIDINTNVSAPFLITNSQFPILDQLQAFRAGEFGTDGMLGAVDIITLGVIVMVMIGFNRWNETVGAIFAVGILGGLSFFEIVEWQTFMFGTFAIVIMLVIGSTRKQ